MTELDFLLYKPFLSWFFKIFDCVSCSKFNVGITNLTWEQNNSSPKFEIEKKKLEFVSFREFRRRFDPFQSNESHITTKHKKVKTEFNWQPNPRWAWIIHERDNPFLLGQFLKNESESSSATKYSEKSPIYLLSSRIVRANQSYLIFPELLSKP